MNFIPGAQCYYDNPGEKKCYPADCQDVKPVGKEWVMYGVSWCPYCKKALELLRKNKINYYYYDVESSPFNTKDNYRSMLNEELNGHHTLPAVFKDGKLVGGYTDLVKLLN